MLWRPLMVAWLQAGVGILSILDEELILPKGSDTHMLSRMQIQHRAHPHYKKPRFQSDQFTIVHYAGQVRQG